MLRKRESRAVGGRGALALLSSMLWQGLLPLMELSVCPLEGSREHAFQITGVWEHGWGCLC